MYKKRPYRGSSARQNSRVKKPTRKKQYIPEAKFINHTTVKPEQDEAYVPSHAFRDFRLAAQVQTNLERNGFATPSAIQDTTIPYVLDGRDVIGLANTGTGKTAAFLLPIITKLMLTRTLNSVLILAPTRELATQIDDEFRKFASGMKLFSVLLVGGVNINPQLRGLARGPHIIIGTPGRVKDHIERKSLRLSQVDTFVLDEADRMLDMGFVTDIRAIASLLPMERQTLCFSATFSDGVKAIAADFMRDPEYVSVKVTETNDHIYQDVVHYNNHDHRRELLLEMLGHDEFEKVIIFGETKYGVQRLSDLIDHAGIPSRAIHGNKSQGQRNRALDDFKASKARVLVATDVAARGLDIPDVSHVINFDTPTTYDDYVHRIGRTGRGGKSGQALTFVEQSNGEQSRPQARNASRSTGARPAKSHRRSLLEQKEDSLLAAIDSL